MKIIETTTGALGTRSLIAWSYKNLSSMQELKNVLVNKTLSDIFDVIPYYDGTGLTRVAFQVGGEGLFKDYKESWRYTCPEKMFENYLSEHGTKTSFYDRFMNWLTRV